MKIDSNLIIFGKILKKVKRMSKEHGDSLILYCEEVSKLLELAFNTLSNFPANGMSTHELYLFDESIKEISPMTKKLLSFIDKRDVKADDVEDIVKIIKIIDNITTVYHHYKSLHDNNTHSDLYEFYQSIRKSGVK